MRGEVLEQERGQHPPCLMVLVDISQTESKTVSEDIFARDQQPTHC